MTSLRSPENKVVVELGRKWRGNVRLRAAMDEALGNGVAEAAFSGELEAPVTQVFGLSNLKGSSCAPSRRDTAVLALRNESPLDTALLLRNKSYKVGIVMSAPSKRDMCLAEEELICRSNYLAAVASAPQAAFGDTSAGMLSTAGPLQVLVGPQDAGYPKIPQKLDVHCIQCDPVAHPLRDPTARESVSPLQNYKDLVRSILTVAVLKDMDTLVIPIPGLDSYCGFDPDAVVDAWVEILSAVENGRPRWAHFRYLAFCWTQDMQGGGRNRDRMASLCREAGLPVSQSTAEL